MTRSGKTEGDVGGHVDVLRFLGLARRAGALATGTSATRDALRRGRARLVVTAADAAEGQLDKLEGLLRARAVRRITVGTRTELGAAVGGPPLTAVAVLDEGFAKQVLRRSPDQGSRPAGA
jgi:ribosomal protein L7Ae-like RNA K-turn-binding protein